VNNNSEINSGSETVILGIAGAPGIVVGRLFVLRRDKIIIKREIIPQAEIESEIQKFRDAVNESVAEIAKIKRNISGKIDDEAAGILEAHVMSVNDVELHKEVESIIRKDRLNAEFAYNGLISKVIASLEASDSDYLRQRVFDIKGIRSRVLSNLRGMKQQSPIDVEVPSIIAAKSLSAGEVAQMAGSKVLGLITAAGGATSHTALLAKSLNIPAVLGIEEKYSLLKDGMDLILDGNQGKIILSPTRVTNELYRDRRRKFKREHEQLLVARDEPALTLDGHRVELLANIELISEVDKALAVGAEGIGLYRSEFMYFTHGCLPSEEQQYRVYSAIVKKMAPNPVTIRTFDLGGDKFIDETSRPYEQNPFLGWRAIRISLALPEYFKSQLRAILKATVHGNVSIMIPMVCDLSEVKIALRIFRDVQEELSHQGIPFDALTKFGVMIEVPSAALSADVIASHVDFFSIGTNDLTQYTLAVDRGNEMLKDLFQSFHPAVLKLTSMTVDAAKRACIPVSVCGELAGDPLAAALLIGFGATSLSAPYASLPLIKNIIRKVNYEEAKHLSEQALKMESTSEVRNLLANFLTEIFEGMSSPI